MTNKRVFNVNFVVDLEVLFFNGYTMLMLFIGPFAFITLLLTNAPSLYHCDDKVVPVGSSTRHSIIIHVTQFIFAVYYRSLTIHNNDNHLLLLGARSGLRVEMTPFRYLVIVVGVVMLLFVSSHALSSCHCVD
jgi:hypothetical protein